MGLQHSYVELELAEGVGVDNTVSVRISEGSLLRAKMVATAQHKSIGQFISEAIEEKVTREFKIAIEVLERRSPADILGHFKVGNGDG